MRQIVDYKNEPGNGYGKTLLCFIQFFIVSSRADTWYFANNNAIQSQRQAARMTPSSH
jgi:type I restriction enzyme R subunit